MKTMNTLNSIITTVSTITAKHSGYKYNNVLSDEPQMTISNRYSLKADEQGIFKLS